MVDLNRAPETHCPAGPANEWNDYAEHAELVPYGPQTDQLRQAIARLQALTLAEARSLAEAHRELWGYPVEQPADHPDRIAAWQGLRAALEAACRVEHGGLGPAYLDACKVLRASPAGVARWPALDAIMALFAADLAQPGTDWTPFARALLLRPWEMWTNWGEPTNIHAREHDDGDSARDQRAETTQGEPQHDRPAAAAQTTGVVA